MRTQTASLKYECPHCAQIVVYAPEHLGVSGACPHCSNAITLPGQYVFTSCPHCRQSLEYLTSMAGDVINCPACSEAVTLPRPQKAAPPAVAKIPVASPATPTGEKASSLVGRVAFMFVVCAVVASFTKDYALVGVCFIVGSLFYVRDFLKSNNQ
jgi:hypothetical protein